jgi:hypothetical protein
MTGDAETKLIYDSPYLIIALDQSLKIAKQSMTQLRIIGQYFLYARSLNENTKIKPFTLGQKLVMSDQQNEIQKNNPLHGLSLEKIVTALEAHYGWEELGQLINIRCCQSDPSIKSSLKFLRKTPWARSKVEELYIKTRL